MKNHWLGKKYRWFHERFLLNSVASCQEPDWLKKIVDPGYIACEQKQNALWIELWITVFIVDDKNLAQEIQVYLTAALKQYNCQVLHVYIYQTHILQADGTVRWQMETNIVVKVP